MRNLTPAEFSEMLRTDYGVKRTVDTLAKIRCVTSNGPQFIKAGRSVLYPEDMGREWAESLLSAPMRSTSEAA